MISLPGTMQLQRHHGRRGQFSTAELTTLIGLFKLKSQLLDQFDPGSYTGNFLIERIYTASTVWRNNLIVELRADVADIAIDAEAPPTQENASDQAAASPDPMDEVPSTSQGAVVVAQVVAQALAPSQEEPLTPAGDLQITDHTALSRTVADGATPIPADLVSAAADTSAPPVSIFDATLAQAIEQRQPLKLDTTVDRALFRQQRDLLKAIGYWFNAKEQTWYYTDVGAPSPSSATVAAA
jgi:Protein of unknown function (DUF3275)